MGGGFSGQKSQEEGYIVKEPVAGENLYLTIDMAVQQKLYDLMEKAVVDYKAVGGAAVIESVQNGELIALVSNPGFDNNLLLEVYHRVNIKDYLGTEKSFA